MKIFTSNIGLKLIALTLALLIYLMVRDQIDRANGHTSRGLFARSTRSAQEEEAEAKSFAEAAEDVARRAEAREQRSTRNAVRRSDPRNQPK